MRGQWISETRKLNRHYQSGGDDDDDDGLWDASNGSLFAVEKGGELYYNGALYADISSGKPLIYINTQTDKFVPSGVAPGVMICHKELNLVPYWPRSDDGFFATNPLITEPIVYKAGDDGLKFTISQDFYTDTIDQYRRTDTVAEYAAGEILSSKIINLLKYKVDAYVCTYATADLNDTTLIDNIVNIIKDALGKDIVKIDGHPIYAHSPCYTSGGGTYTYNMLTESKIQSIFGTLNAATNVTATYYGNAVGDIGNWGIYPFNNVDYIPNGDVKVTQLTTSSVPHKCSNDFTVVSRGAYIDNYDGQVTYNLDTLKKQAVFRILREISTIKCPITG